MVVKFFTDEKGFAISKKQKKTQVVSTVPIKREFIPIDYYNYADLANDGGNKYTMIFDIESYRNYFLIGFYCIETKKYVIVEDSPDSRVDIPMLEWIIWNFRLVGFNSRDFDMPLLFCALRGYDAERLKWYTNRFINKEAGPKKGLSCYQIEKEFGIVVPQNLDHIDIMRVCPLEGSLKKYSARLHAKRLQDLPFDPEKILDYDEAQVLKNYCLGADIPNTLLIFNELAEQIKLRYSLSQKYNTDLRSKSDAQIAEAVISAEVKRITGKKVKRTEIGEGHNFKYIPPPYLNFESELLKDSFRMIQNMDFFITEEGKVSMPEELKEMELRIADTYYKLGKGGLHSKEKSRSYKAENGYIIVDIDVESFYPKLILNSGLYPEAIGPVFLEIFAEIVNRRLNAKKSAKEIEAHIKEINKKLEAIHPDLQIQLDSFQSEADGLKITINGTFGKLGSRWSIMYAPNLLIQVTISGQLVLLMLIERFVKNGIQVISANTDGIVLYMHESQYELAMSIKDQWCKETNLKMEETQYMAVYSRDVNNYIAIKKKFDKDTNKWLNEVDSVKFKGAYSNPWNDKKTAIFRFHKNPMTTICIEAIEKLVTVGTPVAQTIKQCQDITKFVCTRDVAGGAHKDGVFLGKMIRFYYGRDTEGRINYITGGKNVGESESGEPLMDLPDSLPDDIDYGMYIDKTNRMLHDIGYYKKPEEVTLFD